jgi:hypothetical protein
LDKVWVTQLHEKASFPVRLRSARPLDEFDSDFLAAAFNTALVHVAEAANSKTVANVNNAWQLV